MFYLTFHDSFVGLFSCLVNSVERSGTIEKEPCLFLFSGRTYLHSVPDVFFRCVSNCARVRRVPLKWRADGGVHSDRQDCAFFL